MAMRSWHIVKWYDTQFQDNVARKKLSTVEPLFGMISIVEET